MRKALLLSAATALAFAAAPAAADVFVNATVDKTKDKTVVERLTKNKRIELAVRVDDVAEKFAESMAIVNQRNDNNEACENCAEKVDVIRGSVNGNEGITTLNQASGNMNNQGNAISVSSDAEIPDDPAPDPDPQGNTGFAESQASASQFNNSNAIDSINILFRDSIIRDSVNNNVGVTYVNQAAGQMNSQANLLSVAFSAAPGVALSEADLGQFNSGNTVFESDVDKRAIIASSVRGNEGITGVNQSSGNMANQANVSSIGVATAVQ